LQWRAGPIVYSAACADNSNEYSTRRQALHVGFALEDCQAVVEAKYNA